MEGFPKRVLLRFFIVAICAFIAGCGSTATSGTTRSTGVTAGFGDAYSRWQLQVSQEASARAFIGGLLLVSEPAGSGVHVTAYHEETGMKAWSRDFAQSPLAFGNILLAGVDSASLTAYRSGAASGACPRAITRINPASGKSMWTSQGSAAGCSPLTASGKYVVAGTTILNAASGVTLLQLPADGTAVKQAWAFGNDILVQDGSELQLDALRDGRLAPRWHRDISGLTVLPDYPQITLAAQPGDESQRYEVVNPATGAISTSVMATAVFATPGGITAVSPAGQLLSLSGPSVKPGPKLRVGISYSGGMLWQYLSPNGHSTGPVYASAITPGSFHALGRLVTTQSQVSAEGNDSYLISDGRYAAIVASPVIYVFKL